MKIFLLFTICLAFFDIKSLYEKYDFYYNQSDFLYSAAVALKPIARLTLAATTHIEKDQVILKVPSSHIITTFDHFSISEYFSDQPLEMVAVALILSSQLENSTYLSSYFHQFPSDIESPAAWQIAELLEYLEKFLESPENIDAEIPFYEEYKNIGITIPGLKSMAYEKRNYAWAQSLARTHGIPITKKDWKILNQKTIEKGDEEVKGYAFVPMFELVNQALLPDIHYSENYPIEFTSGFFTLKASRSFETGQEVYMPLWKKNNYQLMMDSGLVIPHNINDRLKVVLPDNHRLYLSPLKISTELLDLFSSSRNPEAAYRQLVHKTISEFKHALRHQRRRVKILDERHLKATFHLCISEKVTAYHVLSRIDRQLLQSFTSKLRLI